MTVTGFDVLACLFLAMTSLPRTHRHSVVSSRETVHMQTGMSQNQDGDNTKR